MKSLFSRFKYSTGVTSQPAANGSSGTSSALGGSMRSGYDESSLSKTLSHPQPMSGTANSSSLAAAATGAADRSDSTIRVARSRSTRAPIPAAVRSAAVAAANARPSTPSSHNGDHGDHASTASTGHSDGAGSSSRDREVHARPTTPGPDMPPPVPPKDVLKGKGKGKEHDLKQPFTRMRTQSDEHPSSSRSRRHAPAEPHSDVDIDDRLPSLYVDLDDVASGPAGDWVRGPVHRMSADNVKKVMFQSPQRFTGGNASDSDLRPRAAPNGNGGPSRRASSPHHRVSMPRRASSPGKPRSSTPTHPRPVSRSSSRASHHVRKVSASDSATGTGSGISHSPTKSTHSNLTPSNASTRSAASYLPAPESWSAAMDEELIANLGPRERNRQEVLWEIVLSEEKYVQDLIKLTETFCKALLPTRDMSPSLSLPDPIARTLSPVSTSPVMHGQELQGSFLPIASQFSSGPRYSSDSYRDSSTLASPDPAADGTPAAEAARQNAYNSLTRGSGGGAGAQPERSARGSSRPGSRSRFSLHGKGGDSSHGRITSRGSVSSLVHQGPVTLPDDLEQVLTVVSTGILEGHVKLVTALRKRYDEQFPLVRNLADVFTSHADLLREYATYILHLERALAQVDEALSMADTIANGPRRSSRRLEETQLGRLSKLLASLEDVAAGRAETGLSISLSKPFQRLLKYPLLFQNLLYNTSPSTREYEATLAMVDEVQQIVRSIEDEKTSNEEREKARDAWARIDGIDKNKQLMVPKPTRLLVSETSLTAKREGYKDKDRKERRSHNRLSDLLKGGRSAEQWIVRFTDVSLLCELTGTTTLPISTTKKADGLKSESLTDLSSTKRGMNKRHAASKARNMYRFIKVFEWHEARLPPPPTRPLGEKASRRTTLENLAEVTTPTTRTMQHPRGARGLPAATPRIVPLKDTDGSPNRPRRRPNSATGTYDDAMSDGVSVMSFAFLGEARPNLRRGGKAGGGSLRQASFTKPTASSLERANPTRRNGGNMPTAAANAKFANRLRAPDEIVPTVRPASRVRRSLPPAMALAPSRQSLVSPDGGTKPPWNPSTRIETPSLREREHPARPPSAGTRPLRPRTVAGAASTVAAKSPTPTGGLPSGPSGTIGLGLYDHDDDRASSDRASEQAVEKEESAEVKDKGKGVDRESVGDKTERKTKLSKPSHVAFPLRPSTAPGVLAGGVSTFATTGPAPAPAPVPEAETNLDPPAPVTPPPDEEEPTPKPTPAPAAVATPPRPATPPPPATGPAPSSPPMTWPPAPPAQAAVHIPVVQRGHVAALRRTFGGLI